MTSDTLTTDAPLARRPRLLDLFSGAGGCAVGYHRAGFDVTGVDVKKQPRYPFAHVVADALDYLREHGAEFDAVHASPPCQAYSRMSPRMGAGHPDLLGPTREALVSLGKPWVIESVQSSRTPMTNAFLLCGTMFGLGVFRHRLFECSNLIWCPPHSRHRGRIGDGTFVTCAGNAGGSSTRDGWTNGGVSDWKTAMGIDWMIGKELAQAIPPAYCEWIGRQLLRAMGG